MTDGLQKKRYPLQTLYVYLTEGCNLRCRHCWIEPKFQTAAKQHAVLDVGLFKAIISQAKPLGLASVKLTGGEPFLHPMIGEVLDVIRSEGLGLIVETNGVLCTADIAKRAASCRAPQISVSLDGADASTHEWVRGVEGCFAAALDGIRNLVAAGLRPQIIMTVMHRNAGQLEDLALLARSLGAGGIKFNLVQPTSRGEKMHKAGETLDVRELIEMGAWVENELSSRAGMDLYYSYPVAFRPLGKMYGNGGNGCGICGIHRILGVLADGSYALCGIGETVPELVFGHASRDSLAVVWEHSAVLKEIREGLPRRLEGVCGECFMKEVCLGGCIAQNYYRSRSLWAPHWFCEEADRKGLFPGTRRRSTSAQRLGRGGESMNVGTAR
jgi:SynChlorMet cassette radical SAM/SPASM protein ScmF